MSAKITIIRKIDDLYAQYEAKLISKNPITATTSRMGSAPMTKTANTGDTVYIESDQFSKTEFVDNETYEINFIPFLYAQNDVKPIVLTVTVVL